MTATDVSPKSAAVAVSRTWTGAYDVHTSAGLAGKDTDVHWNVLVTPSGTDFIARRVEVCDHEWSSGKPPPAFADRRSSKHWFPEPIIWPAWTGMDGSQPGGSPLKDVHDYWSRAGQRLRESAKWMSAVIGAALAVIAGTSPLTELKQNTPDWPAIVVGAVGFLLLAITLFLVLQVMRPVSVSYTDVQSASRGGWNPVRRWGSLTSWRVTVEAQQDLYLPFGIKCLDSLRQAAIIEEVTVVALARAVENATFLGQPTEQLCRAWHGRTARLRELRDAANRVAIIGEYYRLKRRSAWATYLGVPLGVLGTAAMVIAFAWPSA